MVDLMPIHSV